MTGSPAPRALFGLRVIDLTRVLGGPYCTQILGDHGADIVKIEPPQGDEVRHWGPPFDEGGDASYFIGVNRNKRSMGLDLRGEDGRKVLLRLLEGADVLIENYKPGTMERWGLGFEDVLSKRFPKLIHCRISGFGADGPLGGFPGYDAVIQAMVGMFSVNGDENSGPTRMGVPMVDIGTGLYAAIAVLMAINERHRSGTGQYIDMTLYDCGVSLMHPHIANYCLGGKLPGLTGNAHPNIGFYDKYPTATVDVFLAIGNERAFRRTCETLGHPELVDDPRFATNAGRVENRSALTALVVGYLEDVDGHKLCDDLLAIGVPAGPVQDTAQVMAHPHTEHRQMVMRDGDYRGFGTPIKLSRTPGGMRRKPPRFGEHGREVLREVGYSDAEIESLLADAVVMETRGEAPQ
jgi:crotonobetainyl-CoA:carnitine CoA-transferase CaiB-like acyl-CoA transferase